MSALGRKRTSAPFPKADIPQMPPRLGPHGRMAAMGFEPQTARLRSVLNLQQAWPLRSCPRSWRTVGYPHMHTLRFALAAALALAATGLTACDRSHESGASQ